MTSSCKLLHYLRLNSPFPVIFHECNPRYLTLHVEDLQSAILRTHSNFHTTVNNCFTQQTYLHSEKLHAHKKWYNALCCVWTWFLALQLFQFGHKPLANRHESRLGQGSNNFCIQISYNVYICCIWSTLNSGRLNKNFNDWDAIFKFTYTKMQRYHDENANTQWPLSYLTLANLCLLPESRVNNKFNCQSLLHSCDSQAQIK